MRCLIHHSRLMVDHVLKSIIAAEGLLECLELVELVRFLGWLIHCGYVKTVVVHYALHLFQEIDKNHSIWWDCSLLVNKEDILFVLCRCYHNNVVSENIIVDVIQTYPIHEWWDEWIIKVDQIIYIDWLNLNRRQSVLLRECRSAHKKNGYVTELVRMPVFWTRADEKVKISLDW
jgi:hypothetical protein